MSFFIYAKTGQVLDLAIIFAAVVIVLRGHRTVRALLPDYLNVWILRHVIISLITTRLVSKRHLSLSGAAANTTSNTTANCTLKLLLIDRRSHRLPLSSATSVPFMAI